MVYTWYWQLWWPMFWITITWHSLPWNIGSLLSLSCITITWHLQLWIIIVYIPSSFFIYPFIWGIKFKILSLSSFSQLMSSVFLSEKLDINCNMVYFLRSQTIKITIYVVMETIMYLSIHNMVLTYFPICCDTFSSHISLHLPSPQFINVAAR